MSDKRFQLLQGNEAVVEGAQVNGAVLLVAHLCQFATLFHFLYSLAKIHQKAREYSL